MKMIFSSETSVDFQRIIRRRIPEDKTFLQILCIQNTYSVSFSRRNKIKWLQKWKKKTQKSMRQRKLQAFCSHLSAPPLCAVKCISAAQSRDERNRRARATTSNHEHFNLSPVSAILSLLFSFFAPKNLSFCSCISFLWDYHRHFLRRIQ
jgi:hypothetical protein